MSDRVTEEEPAARVVNPFEPPATVDSKRPTPPIRLGQHVWWSWPMVVLFNCVLPGLIAFSSTGPMGKFTILASVLAFIVAGLLIARTNIIWIRRATAGGVVVGVLQLFPVLQIFAGVIAAEFVTALGLGTPHLFVSQGQRMPPIVAAAMTWIVGAQLFIAATIPGSLLIHYRDRNAITTVNPPGDRNS